jgi:arylsulfatase A-like enzyme
MCAHWDILPTYCDLAGIEPPEDTDGVSLVPTLLGKPDEQKAHRYLYWEFFERGGKRAARWGKWKAVQNNVHKAPDGPIELYNLEDDPEETKNVAGSHPELIDEAKKIFDEAHSPSKEWPFKKLDP